MNERVQRAKNDEDGGDGDDRPAIADWGPPPARASAPSTGVGFGAGTPASPCASAQSPAAQSPSAQSPPPPQPPPPPPSSSVPWNQAAAGAPYGSNTGWARPEVARPLPTVPTGVALAAVAAAFAFNFSLQSRVDSLVTLVGVTIIAVVLVAQPGRRRPSVIAPATLAVAAATITVLRASPWVVVPAILVWTSCLIIASQGTLFAGVGLSGAVGTYLLNFKDAIVIAGRSTIGPNSRSRTAIGAGPAGDSAKQRHVARGVLAATIVIIPLTWLLASADAAFGRLVGQAFQGSLFVHLVVTATVLPAVLATAVGARSPRYNGYTSPAANTVTANLRSRSTMVEATIVLCAVAALLALWGATQVIVALGGGDRLLATADLTAAANARQGFFQLVAATALLVLVIMAVDKLVTRSGPSEQRPFLILTAIIGVETVGVVIATYARLALYIERFGNTMLRTSVAWFLAWLTVVMAILIVAVNRRSQRLGSPVGPMFLLACLWVVGFGLFNPEAFVARGNIERHDAAGPALDLRYLSEGLGTDAMPAIVERFPSLTPATRSDLAEDLCEASIPDTEYGPLGWNRSSSEARGVVADLDCESFRP